MAKKKKKVKKAKKKKVSKKKKTRSKSNIIKIQVEAKAPRKKASKKKTKKKASKRKSRVSVEKVQIEMQPILVENFVALQKVMVNLSAKLDNQNTQLTRLLNLFELSAKSLAKKGFKLEGSEAGIPSKEVMDKLGELSEQNKVIARGMTLIHETVQAPPPAFAAPAPVPAPAVPTPKPLPVPGVPKPEEGEYKKSAPSKSKIPVKKVSEK